MSERVHFNLSRDLYRSILGKSVVVTLLGLFFGYLYDQSTRADNLKAQTLTLADYTQGYEAYKAHLTTIMWPLWGNVLLVLIMVGVCFLLYELLGAAIGWLLVTLVPPLRIDFEPSQSDSSRPTP